jgi:DNA-binding IscR family transcriptional regulator
VYRLAEGGILARVDGNQDGVVPARPPDTLTVADVLEVVRTQPASDGEVGRAGSERVTKLLAELDAALRSSSANRRFSELVG